MQRRVSGKLIAVRAVIWCLFSLVWIYLSGMRIRALLALGRTVDWKNWAILAFWIAVLVFWAVMGIRSWMAARQRRAEYRTYERSTER